MSEHPYNKLRPENILDAVESLGYQCDGRINALNSYENRVFQIGLEDQKPIIAKFYRPDRWSEDQVKEEHDFCFELADAEWPLVPPIKHQKTGSLHKHDHFLFTLFERAGGHAPELDDLDTLLVLGRSLGRLHAIGAERPFIHRPELTIHSYGIESREYLINNNCIPKSLRPAYNSLSQDLIKLIKTSFDQVDYSLIRLHGDCHPGNILWRNDKPIFVDFDDCRSGPAIQDLWMLLSGEAKDRELQLDVILEGYEQFYEFNDAELILVEALRTLRMMHYATWLAKRWTDPAFPMAFPWFNTERYWEEHILQLREQFAELQQAPLQRMTANI
ncbi:MAG: serine/threonine protein kinase [Gammaproteobacteria bacterium]|nr:serine/threonine protein kinase [Gammaproteobacteria bacterium]